MKQDPNSKQQEALDQASRESFPASDPPAFTGVTGVGGSGRTKAIGFDKVKETIWLQFGASIDMLENAIRMCPEKLWASGKNFYQFWYMVSHTLFWLDYYLSEDPQSYAPQEPFNMCELNPEGELPPRVYTKDELLTYLQFGSEKLKRILHELTVERANSLAGFHKEPLTVLELLLYNLRHVQHHTAQLNMLLRQNIDDAPRWVKRAGGSFQK